LSQIGFYSVWPFSATIERLLQTLLPQTTFNWIWQVVCLVGFASWDMLGIPLCVAAVVVLKMTKRRTATGYYWFTMGVVALSMILAMSVTMGYDQYSVPGQLLYHLGWYVLPIGGVAVTWLVSYALR